MAAHLQHPARPRSASGGMAEAGIEEPRVMHPEFANHRQIGGHFGSIVRRDRHRLAADEDIESTGIKDDAPLTGAQLLPELRDRVVGDPVKVDHPGMGFGAVADKITMGGAQVDRKAKAFGNDGLACDQGVERMQG